MKAIKQFTYGGIIAASMLSASVMANEMPTSFTVGTASQGGTYFTYGSGWANMNKDFVYDVVKTVMGDHDDMMRIHKAAKSTIPENYVHNTAIKWHLGAVQWFEENVDSDIIIDNQRLLSNWSKKLVFIGAIFYALFHIVVLNLYPIESWTYRILHVMGALILGYAIYNAKSFNSKTETNTQSHHQLTTTNKVAKFLAIVAVACTALSLFNVLNIYLSLQDKIYPKPDYELYYYGIPLVVGTILGVISSWLDNAKRNSINMADIALIFAVVASSSYLLVNLDTTALRMRAGTNFVTIGNVYAALTGMLLLLELTRRLTGNALVVIILGFIAYGFCGPYLPSFLSHNGFQFNRFITYLYTDKGILGTTTAVSSTYIILFIIFAAFLQVSKVGEYFVNFSFALAGKARGGPAKVAVFSSGLMGMINGTSAGNVVATGSLTIPLMKKVGYRPKMAASIEAAASTGGQIMPPIMGAGAFIMAEITGIPYTEIVIAALIPAIFYFFSIYFMVDMEAARENMHGIPKDQLPTFAKVFSQIYLFIPILILILSLFFGYSVIRSGTLAIVAAIVVSWLTPHKVGLNKIIHALNSASVMAVQIIIVCAAAGMIVGSIALTGVGARFSSMLLTIAENSQILALFFAMVISIILGMGMPTTAAYAIAASVVAPGLIDIGITPLTAHFFVFYFAVVSAITPPVALASYAAAGIAGSNPMATSIHSFKVGLTAFIVPFMAYFNPAVLMQGDMVSIGYSFALGLVGIYILIGSLQGWLFGRINKATRIGFFFIALALVLGIDYLELVALAVSVVFMVMQRKKNNLVTI
ncbi:TRAP transporter fused permease subunit [Vibrio sp. SS-MA-C1-2]|uniref:TRAP transporter permease n=1 Tax=Vibrio sp. SS-MA-C1-2 TaxID=2908646 RepID=UPI001F2962D6|nr:TRAP transporter permease [Vibrio sp. SS-MA-C1-2]UJF17942.1 TRAP transporter fused permease subunit [Vibrio sp. SS-MA-C1-2]